METPPIPARQIGTSMPKRSHRGVRSDDAPAPFDGEAGCMGRTFDAAPTRVKATTPLA